MTDLRQLIEGLRKAREKASFALPIDCDDDYDLYSNENWEDPAIAELAGTKRQIGSVHYGHPLGPYLALAVNSSAQLETALLEAVEVLREIAAGKSQTILGPSQHDDCDTFQRAHELGANKAFVNQAGLAEEFLTKYGLGAGGGE